MNAGGAQGGCGQGLALSKGFLEAGATGTLSKHQKWQYWGSEHGA